VVARCVELAAGRRLRAARLLRVIARTFLDQP
jgi:hypothetical protein